MFETVSKNNSAPLIILLSYCRIRLPQSTLENEEAEEEGMEEDEEHVGRYPPEMIQKLHRSMAPSYPSKFNMIPLPKDDMEYANMRAAVRSMDDDQRMALNVLLDWVIEQRTSPPDQIPDPPLLIVHGRPGSGKTHLINTMATVCEYFLRYKTKMSETNYPAIIKLAPTGRAANGVDGQTLCAAFNLPWGNDYNSLSSQEREKKRSELRYLSIVIIDEMSMVKADQLYQIHERLQEIKQNDRPFGGVSIVLSGDLRQLPPVQAAQIFEAPWGEKYKDYHEMDPLWDRFECIELTHNHRQAEDWHYAELLNRIGTGEHTEEDLRTLASRISDQRPKDAFYIFGTNEPCKKHNDAALKDLEGEEKSFKAHFPKGYRMEPNKKTGKLGSSGYLDELHLKIGARIMLIHNVDTSDYLSNGTMGYVAAFHWSGGKNPEITKILVKADDPKAGAKERARHPIHPKHPEATPIGKVCHEPKGKKNNKLFSQCKFIQLPIDLAWAITAHKCQGMTIKPPNMLVADLDSIFLKWNKEKKEWEAMPGMAYVMLSRVQNSSQLILRWSYDPYPKSDAKSEKERLEKNEKAIKKIQVNEDALRETQRLKAKALNNYENKKRDPWLSSECLKIVSLNVQGSLQTRLEDLESDKMIHKNADIICLQETGHCTRKLDLDGYSFLSAGGGKNKGVAIYVKNRIEEEVKEQPDCINDEFFQGLKLSCTNFDLITVYRANNQPASSFTRLVISFFSQYNSIISKLLSRFTDLIEKWITKGRATMICGDLNLRTTENEFSQMMSRRGFKQVIQKATHIQGGCIDHFYHNISHNKKKFDYNLHGVYYSDHRALCVMIDDA